jgi:fluoride ion exporter CrcB/FEX
MDNSGRPPRALALTIKFTLACLGGAAWMRFIIRQGIVDAAVPLALAALVVGVTAAWLTLQKWRSTHPHRCATITGFCGGIGGAGFVLLLRIFLPLP